MTGSNANTCPFCASTDFDTVTVFDAPPPLEVHFELAIGEAYRRELLCCRTCGHFLSIHGMDLSALYDGAYADANYAGDKLRKTFERIIALPADQSDNSWRIKRVSEYVGVKLAECGVEKTALDIGSGLAVFPYAMKNAGWTITALDPDPRQSAHARDVAGVDSLHADFMTATDLPQVGLVTFNKVLEHVADPIRMLRKAHECLVEGGWCYVELPDGEAAIRDDAGPEREEFTIDHPHVFSAASMALLAKAAGFRVESLDRIREPSGKYTMYMFLTSDSQAAKITSL